MRVATSPHRVEFKTSDRLRHDRSSSLWHLVLDDPGFRCCDSKIEFSDSEFRISDSEIKLVDSDIRKFDSDIEAPCQRVGIGAVGGTGCHNNLQHVTGALSQLILIYADAIQNRVSSIPSSVFAILISDQK